MENQVRSKSGLTDLNHQHYNKSSGIFLRRKIWMNKNYMVQNKNRYEVRKLPDCPYYVINNGDKFTLQLDTKNHQMRFWINHEIYWNWRSIEKMNSTISNEYRYNNNTEEYWMIVSLYNAKSTKVELLNYNEC